jgi:hypothetical protein
MILQARGKHHEEDRDCVDGNVGHVGWQFRMAGAGSRNSGSFFTYSRKHFASGACRRAGSSGSRSGQLRLSGHRRSCRTCAGDRQHDKHDARKHTQYDGVIHQLRLVNSQLYSASRSRDLRVLNVLNSADPIELGAYEQGVVFNGLDTVAAQPHAECPLVFR